ncbi:hypothetical protein PCL_11525 [Purpureocillium lilacinum]|uniref:Enoyl-CoA hydratase/isomerase family protein n=1 Tax=Purpureocillium lilacinum TaxID=33203 RepID=A0A2U3EAB9_PURLI|nr:hypothetical protein Purlil1_2780 [Purpureocillium lilacinum]PWI71431.1 hypothetical protein PCL_11525 [Purpureocillium lilacinum]
MADPPAQVGLISPGDPSKKPAPPLAVRSPPPARSYMLAIIPFPLPGIPDRETLTPLLPVSRHRFSLAPSSSSVLLALLPEATSPVDGVRLIALNRSSKRNALSRQLIAEFLGALSTASTDPGVKAIVITGNGPFFCAGADLNDIAALDSAGARSCRYLEDLCSGVAAVRKPVIAAVNGPAGVVWCLLRRLQLGGGFELALMCDLIVAAKSAYFALPETQRGLIPGAGGTQRLTAAVGKYMPLFFAASGTLPALYPPAIPVPCGGGPTSLLLLLVLAGGPIAAEEALSCGLLCDLVDDGDLLQHAINVGAGLGERGPEALQFAKEAICRADGLCRDDLFERNLYYATFGTEEKRRGVDDFLAKRNKSGGSRAQPPGAPN